MNVPVPNPQAAGTDPIVLLADHVHNVTFDDLPPEAVDTTKRFILDVIATTIAGSRAPMVREVLDLLAYWGGTPEATTAIFGTRLPMHHAVVANIMICHALELDEFHDEACTHALTPAFWSALAAAEASGGCDGKTFLAAVAVAADLKHRLGLATDQMYYLGFHKARLATLTAAAAVCKVQGRTREQILNALGIAYCQSSGTTQTVPDGALMKRLTPALNASDGVRSVEMAMSGVRGEMNVVGGPGGLFEVFNGGERHPELIERGLGRTFLGGQASVKRNPSCRCANGPIEALTRLREKQPFAISDIRKVQVLVSEGCKRISGDPFVGKSGAPIVDAQFSIDFNIAVALLYGDVFIEHFEPSVLQDSRVLELAAKVEVLVDPELRGVLRFEPATVEIELNSGVILRHRLEHMYGTPNNPMSWEDFIAERLERCIRYSGIAYSDAQKTALIDAVRNLENMKNVTDLLGLIGKHR